MKGLKNRLFSWLALASIFLSNDNLANASGFKYKFNDKTRINLEYTLSNNTNELSNAQISVELPWEETLRKILVDSGKLNDYDSSLLDINSKNSLYTFDEQKARNSFAKFFDALRDSNHFIENLSSSLKSKEEVLLASLFSGALIDKYYYTGDSFPKTSSNEKAESLNKLINGVIKNEEVYLNCKSSVALDADIINKSDVGLISWGEDGNLGINSHKYSLIRDLDSGNILVKNYGDLFILDTISVKDARSFWASMNGKIGFSINDSYNYFLPTLTDTEKEYIEKITGGPISEEWGSKRKNTKQIELNKWDIKLGNLEKSMQYNIFSNNKIFGIEMGQDLVDEQNYISEIDYLKSYIFHPNFEIGTMFAFVKEHNVSNRDNEQGLLSFFGEVNNDFWVYSNRNGGGILLDFAGRFYYLYDITGSLPFLDFTTNLSYFFNPNLFYNFGLDFENFDSFIDGRKKLNDSFSPISENIDKVSEIRLSNFRTGLNYTGDNLNGNFEYRIRYGDDVGKIVLYRQLEGDIDFRLGDFMVKLDARRRIVGDYANHIHPDKLEGKVGLSYDFNSGLNVDISYNLVEDTYCKKFRDKKSKIVLSGSASF